MCDGFLYACLLFFSTYGIFSLAFFLRDFFLEKKYLQGKCIYTLLPVGEEDVYPEEMVRTLLFKNYKNDVGICGCKIIAVTDGEDDCNFKRIKKIFEGETEVLVCKREEVLNYLEG